MHYSGDIDGDEEIMSKKTKEIGRECLASKRFTESHISRREAQLCRRWENASRFPPNKVRKLWLVTSEFVSACDLCNEQHEGV